MKPNGVPETDAEADMLRAFIPTETLAAIAKVRDEEMAAHDKGRAKMEEACAAIEAIKERMRLDRRALKKHEAVKKEYFGARLFVRTDEAREAAWIAASLARKESFSRGEPPRVETVAQCSARQKSASAIYTP